MKLELRSIFAPVFILILIIMVMFSVSLFAQEIIKSTKAELRLKWYEEHVIMKEKSLLKDLQWQFIGPEVMSGRVTDIAVPAEQKYTMYIATASGGVWKSTNEGTTWDVIYENGPSTSIGDLAVAPSSPNIVWMGQGEANIFRSSMAGAGMYKSLDEGKTWKYMGLAETQHIGRIIVHPENPDIVYVAASGHEYTDNKERGVYKTTDGGETWSKVLYVNERAGASDLAIDPENSNILYAVTWDRIRHAWNDPKPGPESGIYRSRDGGGNWERLSEGLPLKDLTGRIGISVSKTNPNVIYALIDNHNPGRKPDPGELDSYGRVRTHVIAGAEVYRSDDRGDHWKKVSESAREMEGLFGTYGWVFSQIRVDPGDVNTVYIMGVQLMKSVDGGKTFKILDYPGLHGDHHAMWIDPDNSDYVINGNDGGVNLSYDGGKTWKNIENMGVVQFYNVTLDMDEPFNVYGSIQDNGSYKGSVDLSDGRENIPESEWVPVVGGEASFFAVDPTDRNIVYSESFYGRIQRTDYRIGGREGTVRIFPRAKEGEPPLRGQWLAPFIISPHNPLTIYHGMQYLYRSVNRGDSWDVISPDLTYNDPEKQGDISYATITTISESPLKYGLVYVGTDDGKVHVTKNGGVNWNEIMNGLPYKKWVSRVASSAFDECTVYMTQNGKRDNDFAAYVWMSTDCGSSWADISEGIPCGPVNVIKEDPVNPNILYVGSDLGVYVSLDKGTTWDVLAAGLPTTFVHDLVVHPRDHLLVAATHGRGIYVLDVLPIRKRAK